MAVETLARDLGVPVREFTDSDIAYDVHVRRVFLRTGLAVHDEPYHMIDVARRPHPERPGEVDFPAWLIGRTWCGAGIPCFPGCPLAAVCPHWTDAANVVRGG
jgi:endonuclease III